MPQATIEELKKIIALSELSDEHLQWILDHSDVRELEDGASIAKFGEPAELMWFTLEGKVNFYMDINGHQVYYFTFENNELTGGVGGMMPYSRMKTFPGYSYASGPTKLLRMHKDHFHELEQLNPDFIQKLIGYMTTRARVFATTQLQHEKVNALGKLAAGVAHELNNPAAAINRISDELAKRLSRNYKLTEQLLQGKITPQQVQHISSLVEEKGNKDTQKERLTTMQRMDNEDEIAEWLEKNGVAKHGEQAETFSENGFTAVELENTSNEIGKEAFIILLPWFENLLSSQKIIKDLDDASCRISNLVGAIKSHVQMDRTEDMQPTNVHTDIENTLTLLGFKLREKSIVVKKNFCDDLPIVQAYIGELNQVWTNIIDNAIFALEKNGALIIETSCNASTITVCIIDNGPGIPKEIMSRIFDPFFTTKKVGDGNGIGLDVVSRIIKHHNAEIKVNSVPGKTVFEICIPVKQKSPSK